MAAQRLPSLERFDVEEERLSARRISRLYAYGESTLTPVGGNLSERHETAFSPLLGDVRDKLKVWAEPSERFSEASF
jgi:hypothetical protein